MGGVHTERYVAAIKGFYRYILRHIASYLFVVLQNAASLRLLSLSLQRESERSTPMEGLVMGKARSDSAPVSDAVLNSLKIQGIAFRGPFYTRRKNVIFVVEGCILLESELVDLFAQNRLNRDGIREFAMRIGAPEASHC